ncbi:MAG: hypothetical protein H0W73_16315 [Bacteroidetes bacterium]|nr:hypothetical protein [Bacteroidota bacterium]
MKAFLKIFIGILLIGGLVILYLTKYTYSKADEAYSLYLNPFQVDQKYFDKNFETAEKKLRSGDSIAAKNILRERWNIVAHLMKGKEKIFTPMQMDSGNINLKNC